MGGCNYFQMNIQKIERALRDLDAEGIETKSLWSALALRREAAERGVPSEDDTRYAIPSVVPSLNEHLAEGENQVMSAGVLWKGYAYSLTPGQREWLRERYGMTPTQTVSVIELSVWPGTHHPREMTLSCEMHVDPRLRRHVLKSVTIDCVGKFLRESAAIDAAREAERAEGTQISAGEGAVKKVTKKGEYDAFLATLGM